ncbi:Hypothetical predicted protein [Xyrichtys novacula]|uniref:Uncharacterized protein n=1 Tax=Xyrichtys novacula TaxID=13765 RepID=A0AAV1GJ24_XYRNO|nr:Hypothetical predicted protein [Xyrichtys novacula]
MLEPCVFLERRGGKTEKKRGKKKGKHFREPPRLHYHVNLKKEREREIEREKQAGQGPAVGPDPYGAAGSGMNSEWSGWALGCWNLPPSLCEQDDQRQEGALQMARAINR